MVKDTHRAFVYILTIAQWPLALYGAFYCSFTYKDKAKQQQKFVKR